MLEQELRWNELRQDALATIKKGDKVRLSKECAEYKSDNELFDVTGDPVKVGNRWVIPISKWGIFAPEFLIKVGE